MIDLFKKIYIKINNFFVEVTNSALFLLKMPEWLFGSKFRFALVFANISLIIMFVLQVATTSSTGYELKKLERITEELSKEQQKIEVEITMANSLTNLSAKVADSSMTSVSRVQYIKTAPSLVAVSTK